MGMKIRSDGDGNEIPFLFFSFHRPIERHQETEFEESTSVEALMAVENWRRNGETAIEAQPNQEEKNRERGGRKGPNQSKIFEKIWYLGLNASFGSKYFLTDEEINILGKYFWVLLLSYEKYLSSEESCPINNKCL